MLFKPSDLLWLVNQPGDVGVVYVTIKTMMKATTTFRDILANLQLPTGTQERFSKPLVLIISDWFRARARIEVTCRQVCFWNLLLSSFEG